MLGINNILNPRKLFHVVMTLQHPRWVRKLVKEANCGAVVLLTGLGIISISSVVWKSPIIWSLPLLFSHTAPPAVLGMQCFLWTHGWPFSLPGLLSAAPRLPQGDALCWLTSLSWLTPTLWPSLKNHWKRSVFLTQPQCHIPLLCSTCLHYNVI